MVEDKVLPANSEKRIGETQESERYRFLLENLPDVAWTTDQEGRTVFISPNVTRVYGYSPREIYEAGVSLWFGRIHADDRPRVQEAFQALFKENKPFDIEYRIQRKGGNWIWLHDRSVSVYEKNGMRYADGLFSDITERKTGWEATQRLAAIVECSDDAIIGKTLDGIITDWNAGAERLYGYSTGEIIGKSISVLIPSDRPDELLRILERVRTGERVEHFETKRVRKDGKIIDVSLTISTFRDQTGMINGASTIARDISEQKRIEAALRESISLLRATLDSTADGIYVVDRKGNVTTFNRRFAQLWRIPEPILQTGNSMRLREFVADQLEEPKEFLASTQALYDEAERESFDVLRYKDGRVFERYSQPQRVGEQIIGRVWSFRDVTKRRQAEDALRLSEARYRVLVDNASDFIFSIGKEDEIIAINPAGARLLGKTAGEVLGKSLFEAYPKEIAASFSKNAKATLHTGKSQILDEKVMLGGNEIWINTRLEALLDDDRRPYAVLGIARDVTERKQAEVALRSTQDLLAFALEISDIGAWDLSLIDHTAKRSLVHDQIFGYSTLLPEWTYEMFLEHVIPEDRDEVDRKFRHALETLTDWNFECRIRRIDGEIRWIWAAGRHRTDTAGKPERMTGIVQDITERKIMEEELHRHTEHLEELVEARTRMLRETEAKYRQLVDETDTGFAMIDLDGIVIEANEPFQRLVGAETMETVVGHSVFEWVVAEEKDRSTEALALCVKQGYIKDFETVYEQENGTRVNISIDGTLRNTPKGRYLIGLCRDITERRQLEVRLAESQRLAAIGETTAMVGHDLRNPLQGIATTLFLVKKMIMSPKAAERREARRLLDSLEGEIYYMDKIVSDLQDYAGPLTPKLAPTDLHELIRTIMLSMSIPRKVKVEIKDTKDTREVELDSFLMRRVFTNLVTNAIQAMPKGGELTVDTSTTDRDMMVHIRDTGVGIPEENLPRLFDAFFTTKAKGQGLGLAVCKRLVEAQGGSITIESKVGRGSTFTVKLPLNKQ